MRDDHGRYVCDDHLDAIIMDRGIVTFRPRYLHADIDNPAAGSSLTPLDFNGELIDLDNISTVVERECPICLGPKIKWRLKACGHEICEDCLREQMRSSLHKKFLCPFDRRSLFDVDFE